MSTPAQIKMLHAEARNAGLGHAELHDLVVAFTSSIDGGKRGVSELTGTEVSHVKYLLAIVREADAAGLTLVNLGNVAHERFHVTFGALSGAQLSWMRDAIARHASGKNEDTTSSAEHENHTEGGTAPPTEEKDSGEARSPRLRSREDIEYALREDWPELAAHMWDFGPLGLLPWLGISQVLDVIRHRKRKHQMARSIVSQVAKRLRKRSVDAIRRGCQEYFDKYAAPSDDPVREGKAISHEYFCGIVEKVEEGLRLSAAERQAQAVRAEDERRERARQQEMEFAEWLVACGFDPDHCALSCGLCGGSGRYRTHRCAEADRLSGRDGSLRGLREHLATCPVCLDRANEREFQCCPSCQQGRENARRLQLQGIKLAQHFPPEVLRTIVPPIEETPLEVKELGESRMRSLRKGLDALSEQKAMPLKPWERKRMVA